MKKAGFIYAPKQGLFVTPVWTPQREDLLIDLCGAIEDEDRSLVERAEERSGRFNEYSDHRAADSESAQSTVDAIAKGIPFGQLILIGHHSERRARRDTQKIEDGMRRAVRMWDTATYWTDRAAGAIRHAKYKTCRCNQPRTLFWQGARLEITLAAGPWHSSGSWWDGQAWDCDLWDVVTAEPAQALRLRQEHASKAWFVVGLYD